MDAIVHAAGLSGGAGAEKSLQCAVDIDTSTAPPAKQFDLFRTWYQGVADTELMQEQSHSFPAHETVWDLGTLAVMFLELPGSGYRCRWRHLKNPSVDNWYLSLPLSKGRLPGSWQVVRTTLQSFAEPYECVMENDALLAVFLPRDLPFIQSSRIEIREESKRLLADYMLLLHRSFSDLRAVDVSHIATATTNLLAACVSPSHDRITEAKRVIDAVIAERAAKIIAQSLNDQSLASERLCRELGVSRSRLYRIFEPAGGVSNYIRHKRLLKTRDILSDSLDGRPISAIAGDWGFTDPSAYSRMFRKEFGITPKEARVEGWQGAQATSSQQISQPDSRANTLSGLLLRNSFGP
ncbi:helix-turn-helix domain-containing protein [Mesorhizobium sp. BR1-1-9]|uniref:helix-turn-helix domain-containing protein n=1 Tax=unclassified Mesorhizobium TaxID=325217 RepID=UPI001CD11C43|nr:MULTISPECIES: helix-turn-helix domain-containing protein [unclassified Mesorhizobium]MBZ9874446.1 helix-turn-helix domain-containing protein [Mesorhizobium sp. BR1-1-9]MBZ9943172.1 helix-turn-helix domain-containing protein [Mesorhizobium sp. BR1-1-13]